MKITYRESKDVDIFQLAKLFTGAGRPEETADLARLSAAIRNATRVVWAIEGTRLVGFASALTDGGFTGLVTYVVVTTDCQGRGIEEALVDRLVEGYKGVTFLLRTKPATGPFSAALGFKPTGDLCYARKG